MDFLITLLPSDLASDLGILLTILTAVFYIAECFFGYRFIRSWISILGFIFGAIGGFHLSGLIFDQTLYILIGALIGGAVLSALSYKVYLAGIFVIAAYSVFQLGTTLLPLEGVLLYLLSILLGVLAGNLAVKYMRPAIIGITAFHGGIMASNMLLTILPLPEGLTTLTCGLILSIAGILVQFITSSKK